MGEKLYECKSMMKIVKQMKCMCIDEWTFLRVYIFILLSIIASILLPVNAATTYAAEVKNARSSQVGSRVLFEYDLIGDEEESEVTFSVTVDGKKYTSDKLHFEGDYGKVKAGPGKKIYWNLLQDFPRGLSTTFDWEILVGGGKYGKDKIISESERFIFAELRALDKNTKLMWTSDANIASKPMDFWDVTHEFLKGLNRSKHAGYSDWRLPTKEELNTLTDYANGRGVTVKIGDFFNGIGFTNVQSYIYWSSSMYPYNVSPWHVSFDDGLTTNGGSARWSAFYAWPVRGVQ